MLDVHVARQSLDASLSQLTLVQAHGAEHRPYLLCLLQAAALQAPGTERVETGQDPGILVALKTESAL